MSCLALGFGQGLEDDTRGCPSKVRQAGSGALYSHAIKPDEGAKNIILKMAKAKLKKHFSSSRYRFSVSPKWIPGSLLQRNSQEIIAVELKGGVKRYTNFDVLYKHHGQTKRAQIQLTVKIQKKVPVVVHRLSSGSVINEGNLKYQWVPLFQYEEDLIDDANILYGQTVRRTLLPGQPVLRSYVSGSYVIKPGDQVKVIIQRKGIRVQVSGEAREGGAVGDEIKIYSEETRRKYVGKVIRSGIALWKNTL